MIRNRYALITCIFVMAVLCSCSSPASPLPTPAPTVTVQPSHTPSPSATPTDQPTHTPEPTNTAVPVSNSGPWLVFQLGLSERESSDQPPLIICNPDGSGCQNLDIAVGPRKRAPNGLVVGIALDTKDVPTLVIYHLPDGNLVNRFSLLSDVVMEKLPDLKRRAKAATVDQYVQWSSDPTWSADARYLAFNAAIEDTNTDLYLYDREKDVFERLTNEPEPAAIMSWSPDGNEILYYTANYYAMFGGASIKSIYALNLMDRTTRKLYDFPQDTENQLARFHEEVCWKSADTFFAYTSSDYSRNLREVNLKTVQVRVLFPGIFENWGFDSVENVLYVNLGKNSGTGPNFKKDTGIYTVDLKTGVEKQFLMGNWIMNWVPQLNKGFIISREGFDSTLRQIEYGKLEFSNLFSAYPSEDGRYFIGQNSDFELTLYDRSEKPILALPVKGGSFSWLPDSNSFYFRDMNGDLYLYQEQKGWKPVKIASIPNYTWEYVIP